MSKTYKGYSETKNYFRWRIKNIKLLLRLPKRTDNIRLKIALGIPDLCVYLISRLLRLKIKYINLYSILN